VARLTGEPLQVDTFFRPVAGLVRWAVGLSGAAVLALLGQWWWVPVPLVVATLVMEVVLIFRSDRPIVVDIGPEKLVIDDRFAPTLTIRWERVHTQTILQRPRGDGWEVVVVLGSERGVLCSLALQCDEPHPDHVDVDEVDRFLGAQAGLLRATAPPGRAVRQRFSATATDLQQLLAGVPPASTDRHGVRLWRGEAPDLSPFGLHTGSPDAWMVFDEAALTYQVVDEEGASFAEGELRLVDWWVTARQAILLRVAGEDDLAAGHLPLLVLDLGGIRVAVPAPLLADHPRQRPPDGNLHHTHAPEASALIGALTASRRRDMPPPWATDTPPGPGGPAG